MFFGGTYLTLLSEPGETEKENYLKNKIPSIICPLPNDIRRWKILFDKVHI